MRQTTLNELRQKSNPFVCAQVSVIATGQTLQLTKKREILAFFPIFYIRIRLLLVTWRSEKRTFSGCVSETVFKKRYDTL